MLGATGQTGSYLVERLVATGHEVIAARRPVAYGGRVLPLAGGMPWVSADLRLPRMLADALDAAQPDVVYNLAAVTTPGASWADPASPEVCDVNATGVLRLITAMERVTPEARLVHASSSAVYAPTRYGVYGASKLLAHQAVAAYRARGFTASNAVLYSHTSPRQSTAFLLPRMCAVAARAARDGASGEPVTVTNPNDVRDWMFAGDAAAALVMMAEMPPGDIDVASGKPQSVLTAVRRVFNTAGASTDGTTTCIAQSGPVHRERAADLGALHDAGWRPSMGFYEMVSEMVAARAAELQAEEMVS